MIISMGADLDRFEKTRKVLALELFSMGLRNHPSWRES